MSITRLSIASCSITAINQMGCKQIVAWLVGQRPAPDFLRSRLTWAIAHSDDGVRWGRLDDQTAHWRFGHGATTDASPAIRAEALQELRVFGDDGEVLMWRSAEGLRGRSLEDSKPGGGPRDETDPLRTSDEFRILRGDRICGGAGVGFTWVTDAKGAEQILPITVDDAQLRKRSARLHVRHYWAQDAENGTVRIAATRLVNLTTEVHNAS